MKREIWSDLIIFAKVNQHGSFTKTSHELGISPSAISHTIKKLEANLNVRLFHRSTRSLSVTQDGERLLAQLDPAIESLNKTICDFKEAQESVAGRIRLTSHRVAAAYTLLPKLNAFSRKYPDVSVEIDINDGLIDFIAHGFDAGIRRSESLAQDMIAVQLDNTERLIYVAAPAYLQEWGEPETPQEVIHHRTISFRFPTSGSLFPWPFKGQKQEYTIDPQSYLIFNDTDMLLKAALEGCGIACVTERQAQQELTKGKLTQLFHNQSTELPPNFLYFSGRRHVPRALRAFIDFVKVA